MTEESTVSHPRNSVRASRLPRAKVTINRTSDIGGNANVQQSSLQASPTHGIGNSISISRGTKNQFGWQMQTHQESQLPTQIVAAKPVQDSTTAPEDVDGTLPVSNNIASSVGGISQQYSLDGVEDNDGTNAVFKKKARPSLSERTIETLSQVPPSPSSSPQRSGLGSNWQTMPPPAHPASTSNNRSPQNVLRRTARLESSNKSSSTAATLQQPTGRPSLPVTPLRSKASKIGRMPSSAQSVSTSLSIPSEETVMVPRTAPQAYKVRSLLDLRQTASKQPLRKASLNFKDIPTPGTLSASTTKSDTRSSLRQQTTSNIQIGSRIPGKRRISSRPSPSTAALSSDDMTQLNSSANLREAIAKARAAKRQASGGIEGSHMKNGANQPFEGAGVLGFETEDTSMSPQSLLRRIQNAITSGSLNIAAMGLSEVPEQVLRMYDFGEGSKINWSEAVDLQKFIVADNDITVLSDETFPDWTVEELSDDEDKSNIFGGLEVLDFRGNQLTTLPVGLRRLERLQTLNISNNELASTSIEIVSQIPNLKDLNLAKNKLQGSLLPAISLLTQLRNLDIHNNKLTNVDGVFSRMQNLQKLDLSGNSISHLPILEMQDLPLIDLNVGGNQISGTLLPSNFTGLQKLQTCNLSNNQIERLSEGMIQLPELQSMIVDHNHMTTLPNLSPLTKLITITASANKLVDLPDGFIELQSLRNANFSSNDIRVLDPYIAKMENLSLFNIASNPLRDRKFLNMSTSDLKLELSKRLTAVYVPDDYTEAQEKVDNPGAKRYIVEKGILNMSSHNLTSVDIEDIDLENQVNTIRLSGNQLKTLPTNLLEHPNVQPTLKSLDFSNNPQLFASTNQISNLRLPSLQTLNVSDTNLTSIDDLHANLSAPNLTEIDLSHNKLAGAIPTLRETFNNLTTLLASNNAFSSVSHEAFLGLEVIDIRNNDIGMLPPKIGELGNTSDQKRPGRLRIFECSGNRFRVPRLAVLEKGTEAVLRDLRRMVNADDVGDEWKE